MSSLIDTHCHLNFKRFKKSLDQVIQSSRAAGVSQFIIPGTDLKSSRAAIQISKQYQGCYAAVGIHPHHVFQYLEQPEKIDTDLKQITQLVTDSKVKAIGEIGLDLHDYQHTKYPNYHTDPEFLKLQIKVFVNQLRLANHHQLPIIIHNRQATQPLLDTLSDLAPTGAKLIFHCCEPNPKLLEFATQHSCYIGVDGDITYDTVKQQFIKDIPSNLLLLETDSPYLLPEPLRSQRLFPNTPANLPLIAAEIATLRQTTPDQLITQTTQNAMRIFNL